MYIWDLSSHVTSVLIHWAYAKDDYLGNNPVSVGDQILKIDLETSCSLGDLEFCSNWKIER